MAEPKCSMFFLFSLFLTFSSPFVVHGQLSPIVVGEHGGNGSTVPTYIVHVMKRDGVEFLGAEELEEWHKTFLPNTSLDSGEPRLVYSYKEAISGFAARLTQEEATAMQARDGVLRAQPETRLELQTTYTHSFLNLSTLFGVWDTSNSFHGQGIIIGVLDTGIQHPHPSFRGKGMPPKPPGWNAKCYFQRPGCNKKIIGAQAFLGGRGTMAPNDTQGHGTHVAGIAAGNFVKDAEVLGQALGRAAGTAPRAYISVYKVCWARPVGCGSAGVLAGIDQAIQDGVHILQMSFGPVLPVPFRRDDVAVGTFSALRKGIFPCTAAGNYGPDPDTLSHSAPWAMTVGATTTDRRIRVVVTLDDGLTTELEGETAYQPSSFKSDFLPVVHPGSSGRYSRTICRPNSLNAINVKDTIVICHPGGTKNEDKGDVVFAAGGAAMIIVNGQSMGFTTFADPHKLPAAHLNYINATKLLNFVDSNSSARAKLTFEGTIFGVRPAPALAAFSSRGPSQFNGNIVKPDVLAPGVNILSAWPFEVGPNPSGLKTKTFNFLSGTSMATPHVSGIVALIMSKLKNDRKRMWSIPEIQSALITTANTFDLDGEAIFDEGSVNSSADITQRGAGQVNATNAMNPGLVYDITPEDYEAYLCGMFSNSSTTLSIFTKNSSSQCTRSIPAEQLNYPSIGVAMQSSSAAVNVDRTARNVGDANEIYWAEIDEPDGVRVDLSTYTLAFSRVDQEISYEIRFSLKGAHPGGGTTGQGQLSWVSDAHVVTSPIYVAF